MADGPLSTPTLAAMLSMCPACGGPIVNRGACVRCAQVRPRPTFNHTRSDGPFDPCPECAALMGPASREALYRDLICCLLHQMGEMMVIDGHDCETNGRFPCCNARRFLGATKGLQPEKPKHRPVPAGPEPKPLRGTRWLYEAHPGSGHPPEDVLVVDVDGAWVRMVLFGRGSQIECLKTSWVKRVRPYPKQDEAGPEPHLPAGGQVGRSP